MTVHKSQSAPGHSPRLPVDVRGWRRRRLLDAEFGAGLAETVASDPSFDLHALLQLVDRGCPPEVAVRILAPISREGAP